MIKIRLEIQFWFEVHCGPSEIVILAECIKMKRKFFLWSSSIFGDLVFSAKIYNIGSANDEKKYARNS